MKVDVLNPAPEARANFSRGGEGVIPQTAGCYVLTNASGDILYLGKAKNLRRRMVNHLDGREKRHMTPLGKASVFHYALREVSQLSSLESGWTNHFRLTEDGELPHFNKINPPV